MTSLNHIRAAEWACDVAQHVLDKFECVFPDDKRPRRAIEAGRMWARGELKMTDARKASFAAHDAARSAKSASQPQAEAAARAAGHAAATAHVITHAAHAFSYALKASDDPTAESIWQKSNSPCAV
ncbi:putative immunity protein [Paracoccus sp. p3-h83]|uniref:putative immunity protein n=1 Tax=Paracoccus sp. p3-h83 TaxID=3342805 RepID=UPI0035BA3227